MDLSKFLRDYTRVDASQTCAKKLQQSQVVVCVFKRGRWTCSEQDGIPRIGESWCQFYLTAALGLNAEEYARAKKDLFEGSYPVGVYRHKSQNKFAIVYKPKRKYHKEIAAALVAGSVAGGLAIGSRYLNSTKPTASKSPSTGCDLDKLTEQLIKTYDHNQNVLHAFSYEFSLDAWVEYDDLIDAFQKCGGNATRYKDQQDLCAVSSKLQMAPHTITANFKTWPISWILARVNEDDLEVLMKYFEKQGDANNKDKAEVVQMIRSARDAIVNYDPLTHDADYVTSKFIPLIKKLDTDPQKYASVVDESAAAFCQLDDTKQTAVLDTMTGEFAEFGAKVRDAINAKKVEHTRRILDEEFEQLETKYQEIMRLIAIGFEVPEQTVANYESLSKAYVENLRKLGDVEQNEFTTAENRTKFVRLFTGQQPLTKILTDRLIGDSRYTDYDEITKDPLWKALYPLWYQLYQLYASRGQKNEAEIIRAAFFYNAVLNIARSGKFNDQDRYFLQMVEESLTSPRMKAALDALAIDRDIERYVPTFSDIRAEAVNRLYA